MRPKYLHSSSFPGPFVLHVTLQNLPTYPPHSPVLSHAKSLAPSALANISPLKSALSAHTDNFDASWEVLSSSFREIHTKNASHLSYEELYRHAYRIILTKRGELLYQRFQEFERHWLSTEVQPWISNHLTPHLLRSASGSAEGTSANERRAAGETFMKGLRQAWKDHQLCVGMLSDVLMYLVLHIRPKTHFTR